MRICRCALVVVLLLVVAHPAAASHGGIHPTFRREQVYVHCAGDTKLFQVNWLASAGTEYPSWNTTPPTQSALDGAGCGSADFAWVRYDFYDAVFLGTFTGNLRDVTVVIHDFITNNTRPTGPQTLRIYAEIDGKPVFPGFENGASNYTGRTVTVTPTRINEALTDRYEFSITNLGFANEVRDASGAVVDVKTGGLATEHGSGTRLRQIKLFIGGDSFFGGPQPTGTDLWVWDTTEVPSGLTFNPPVLAPDRVAAELPS